jgi:hypothetical protein
VTTGTSEARDYAGTMAGFWSGLQGTLRALDSIAGDSQRVDDRAIATLRSLQYRLHYSSEVLAGVEPPAGARAAHAELARALVDARDATAEVVEALELDGREAAAELLFEWRGALFRVRLARHRLGTRPQPSPTPAEPPYSAAAAGLLALLGAVAFVAGAALVLWPIWAAGLALVAGGLLIHRP